MIRMFVFCICLILVNFSACTREEVPRPSDLKLSKYHHHHYHLESDYKEYDNDPDVLQKVKLVLFNNFVLDFIKYC